MLSLCGMHLLLPNKHLTVPGASTPADKHTGAAPNFHWCMQISYQWVMPPDWQDIEGQVIRGREGAGLRVSTTPFLFWVSYYYTNFLFIWSSVFLTFQQGYIRLIGLWEWILSDCLRKRLREVWRLVQDHTAVCSPSHLPQCPIPHTLTGSTCTNSFIKLYTWLLNNQFTASLEHIITIDKELQQSYIRRG